MEEGGGAGGGGESSRPSSFRASVTGLVRRVSQKVTRENKGGEKSHFVMIRRLCDGQMFRLHTEERKSSEQIWKRQEILETEQV